MAYRARWPGEGVLVDRFADFLRETPGAFRRETPAGHVTGSAWLVNRAGTHVLLTHHRKLGRWLQLGGHADGDARAFHVALREAEEESGLDGLVPVWNRLFDVDVHRIPARGEEPAHLHWDLRYAFRTAGSEAFRVSRESRELRWVPMDRLAELTTEESMLRMARKWRMAAGAAGKRIESRSGGGPVPHP